MILCAESGNCCGVRRTVSRHRLFTGLRLVTKPGTYYAVTLRPKASSNKEGRQRFHAGDLTAILRHVQAKSIGCQDVHARLGGFEMPEHGWLAIAAPGADLRLY